MIRKKSIKTLLIALIAMSIGLTLGCAKNIETEIAIDGCIAITGMPGAEDFAYVEKENILIVSSHDRRDSESVGKLFWIDLTLPPEGQAGNPIDIEYPENFKPHGVSYTTTEGGGKLFVISHPNSEEAIHTVEVFDLTVQDNKWELKHVETLESELFTSPNDLVALPDGTVLVSNDHGEGGDTIKKVHALLGMKSGNVVYYDGSDFIDLGTPESYGNGIAYIVEDGVEYIYRAALMECAIKKFTLDRTDGKVAGLTYVSEVNLGTMPDNLELDADGNILTAAHFNSFTFLNHVKDSVNISPTQIFIIAPDGSFTEIYANKGEEISAGSVARIINGRLYIGQVFGDFILSCPYGE